MAATRLIVLTALAMFAFAANSVLARLAFATAGAEPMSYTGIRLGSGALALYLLLATRDRRLPRIGGSWAWHGNKSNGRCRIRSDVYRGCRNRLGRPQLLLWSDFRSPLLWPRSRGRRGGIGWIDRRE